MIVACLKRGCTAAAILRLVVDASPEQVTTYACAEHAHDLEEIKADLDLTYPGRGNLVTITRVGVVGVS